MDAFEKLKKARGEDSMKRMQEELTKHERQRPGQDDRFWKLELDKAGNGEALIRFLPPVDGEVSPAPPLWSHAFQGPGGWFINNCLTTLGQDCPVCDMNKKLYNSGIEADKKFVSNKSKRKQRFYSNIYVISDPANPENEGKVFLYEYGPMIHNMITAAFEPKFASQQKVNVFDLWEGANFRMRVWTEERGKNKFPQYDQCSFETPSMLDEDEQVMAEIYSQVYPLQEFVSDDKFQSYDKLKERLDQIMDDGFSGPAPKREVEQQPAAKPRPQRESAETKIPAADDDEDFDSKGFFEDLDDDIPF